MTEVLIERNDSAVTVECKGHAGYAAQGSDIVCAAVSILCYSFMQMCLELDADDKVVVKDVCDEEGYFRLEVFDFLGHTENALAMLEAGFKGLIEQYPSYVAWSGSH